MELILLENIINLGKVGDRVKVKDGYGRNFLLKYGKALRSNKENIEYVNKKKSELNKKNLEIKNSFIEIAKQINNKNLKILKETKESGEIYAPIKAKEVSNLLMETTNVSINPSDILIKKEITKIGKYTLEIKLHAEVSAKVILQVEKANSTKR